MSSGTTDARTQIVKVTKAARTQMRCLEATLAIVGRGGMDQFSYENVAQFAGVSRPLVKNYFPEKSDIIRETAKVARRDYQELTLRLMSEKTNPRAKLRVYLEQMLAYPRVGRDSAQFWLVFFEYCAIDPKCRADNEMYSAMGRDRIEALLRDCLEDRDAKDCAKLAENLQQLLTGLIVCFLTEGRFSQAREKNALLLCYQLIGTDFDE